VARIRTIKPDFFRHGDLFDAEKETGLPLRVAFAGLWTAADREGRFEWDPRELKLDCLPHDEVDFSRVLDALATRGFIVKYASGTRVFGHIPSWKKHQVINHRESASTLPEPPVTPPDSTPSTRDARVVDASPTDEGHARGEGKGMEGNGKRDARSLTVAIGPPAHRGPKRYGASLMGAVPASTAALVALGDGRVLEVPEGWAKRQRDAYRLSHADIDTFAKWLGERLQAAGGVVDDGGKRLQWFDQQLSLWRQGRAAAAAATGEDAYWAQWDRDMAAAAARVPDRTPAQVEALLRGKVTPHG
jgi:hypothetical protein